MKNNEVTPLGWSRSLFVRSIHLNSSVFGDRGSAVLSDGQDWYSADIDSQTGEVSGVNAYADRQEAINDAFKRIGLTEQFVMVPEQAGECEWVTFVEGEECFKPATRAIIDTHDQSDVNYPEGFHWAHGCESHAKRMLAIANGE